MKPMYLVFCMMLITIPSFAANVSVEEIGTNYIIWNVPDNVTVYIDGNAILTHGQYYVQPVEPSTKHILCLESGECYAVTSKEDTAGVILHWLLFIIAVGLCVASYYVPISAIPTVIYTLYLARDYLPAHNAGFEELFLAYTLMAVGALAAYAGWYRGK